MPLPSYSPASFCPSLWKSVRGRLRITAPRPGARLRQLSSEAQPNADDAEHVVEETDVLIVGAGPAGLSTAIRLKQLAAKQKREIRVMVLEKGSEVGAHILSGNVLETRALDELFPDWRDPKDMPPPPLYTRATRDKMYFLSEKSAYPLPHPPPMRNVVKENYIISLSNFVRWLGARAEDLGVEVYPGFAGARPLFSSCGKRLLGVATGDVGVAKDGSRSPNYEPGMHIHAKNTVIAEGCHGSLAKILIKKFGLRDQNVPRVDGVVPAPAQTYGIGLKEVWQVPSDAKNFDPGLVMHAVGWPTPLDTYQGSFLYHWHNGKKDDDASGSLENLVSVGMVIGLDYKNPKIRPYMEFQRFKHHPAISQYLAGGKCIAYGARALTEGGFQAIPRLVFPGGVLVGCSAGFMNVPKVKGTHTAMKSGMLAADAIAQNEENESGKNYEDLVMDSWIREELYDVRNVRPGFHKFGFFGGLINAGFETIVTRGISPWTLSLPEKPDHATLVPAASAPDIEYPKPDGVLSFDLLENLARSGTNHNAAQPAHLRPKDPAVHVAVNLAQFGGPEAKFCPAGVYEFSSPESGDPALVINAQNCLHCKTCDIKDPSQSIEWTTPEGGGGPNYTIL